jgi:hypothetical protein
MFNSIVYYTLVGMMIATSAGNLDSKYNLEYKIKSTLYWPVYAVNYFNAVSNINKVDIVQVQRDAQNRRDIRHRLDNY